VVYFASSALVWTLATLATGALLRRPATDGAAVAMASCFGNTVMLGIPIAVTAFGAEATTPAAILVSIETPLLWVVATLHAEWSGRQEGRLRIAALTGLFLELATNPIVMALIVGLAFRGTGLVLPAGIARIIDFLAQAAVPTALVALGLTLSTIQVRGEAPTLALISALKLVLFPALVLGMTLLVAVPPVWAAVAVLFAAMPSGANAYLFAVRYDRVVNSVAGAIVITTLLAGATVSVLLLNLGAAAPR
jgi:predicted permease